MEYGASQEEWDAFIALASADVRPVVCNPTIPVSPYSQINDPHKVPSIINSQGQFTGMRAWPSLIPTEQDLTTWRSQPDYGISLVGRQYKAIDIDIDDEEAAAEVAEVIYSYFNAKLPTRRRPNQSRRLMLFKVSDAKGIMRKCVVNTKAGAVEFLFDRQHFVVAGMHKTGVKHFWEDGLPTDAPTITYAEIVGLIKFLTTEFGVGVADTNFELDTSDNGVGLRFADQVDRTDDEYLAVINSPYFREELPDGKVAVHCPWQAQHTSTNGEEDPNLTATTYFPRGLGGRAQSGFKCLHASHGEKSVGEFLDKVGYVPAEFELVEDAPGTEMMQMPAFQGRTKGGVPCTATNLHMAVSAAEWMGVKICMDEFTGTEMIAWKEENYKWRPFRDADFPRLSIRLSKVFNINNVSKDRLRDEVCLMADINAIDMAKEWLNDQEWDGVHRIANTAKDILYSADTEYASAVSMYLWTALAGRIISPGVKADMIPVLIGKQGCHKSTFVHALSPRGLNWAGDMSLSTRDTDTSRLVRGRVILEIPELNGIASREEEHIKAWVTKQADSWVPKYKESQITVQRRFVMIGTHNYMRFLSDSSGNRRWLPLKVGVTKRQINTELLSKELNQYWAEAREVFNNEGILWERAEELAKPFLPRHMAIDPWAEIIVEWLRQRTEGEPTDVSVMEIARGALNMAPTQVAVVVRRRIENVLRLNGYEQDDDTARWSYQTLL